MRRLALALLLSGCCTGGSSTPPPPSSVAPPPSTVAPVVNPTTITVGAAPVTVVVAAAPHWSFVVETAGEYEIDATAPAPQNVHLALLDERGWSLASDGDSGDGTNARIAMFLRPGTYSVRASEERHLAADVEVSATALDPLPSLATITPGMPPTTVESPAGEWHRAASVEVAITIVTAGTYRISARGGLECTSEMELRQDAGVLAESSNGGPNGTAQIDQPMQPGTYSLRLRDTIDRACTHSVTVAPVP